MDLSYLITPEDSGAELALFAAAMDAAVNGIVITDNRQPDNPIIYCNKAFQELTGYAHREIIGRNCRFLQGEQRDQAARYELREAVRAGRHCRIELRNYTKKGSPFWNELTISPVRNAAGELTHFVGIQNDISRRRDAEAGLQQEKEHLEDRVKERTRELEDNEDYLGGIVETIRESLIVLDERMKVLSINEHFRRFFKVSDQEIVGRQLYEFAGGVWDIAELKNLLENVLPHNNPVEGFEVEHDFPIIGKKLLVLNARQITLKGKFQSWVLLAIEDITERRKIEQRKEDFITVASHEMKTPLTSIKGHLQLLKRKSEKAGDTAYTGPLTAAAKSVDRLDKLINDLLDVAKIQSGKIGFNYTGFNFGELVREAISVVQAGHDTHRIVLTGSAEISLTADYYRVEQVLINLLSNAIKYSPLSNEVGVHLAVLAGFVKVSVADHGVGIRREEHRKIFERFYRVEDVQQHYQGIGIGLYVCSQIILEHKGTLWVESEPGQGSVFNFTLPVNASNI